ncbi:hypothetical protein [Sphaerospermopsis aphanizomenoides]|uniref:hypothetical protein n=1 Tax=Sphaerospermopsis aphanizomenoides TaxID=459663 RepID=UPI001F3194B9|nr:hypothetical protein [Sphaerospermopsis aphanizomenoides]
MNAKITATFAIIAALVGVNSTVYAQSTENPQPGSFTLSGDSLVNINNRNSENDFGKFFDQQNQGSISNTTGTENTVSTELPLSESITIPSTPIFLQPAYQNLNENDGLQLQLDLSDGN